MIRRILFWVVFVALAVLASLAIVYAQELGPIVREHGGCWVTFPPNSTGRISVSCPPSAGQQEKKPTCGVDGPCPLVPPEGEWWSNVYWREHARSISALEQKATVQRALLEDARAAIRDQKLRISALEKELAALQKRVAELEYRGPKLTDNPRICLNIGTGQCVNCWKDGKEVGCSPTLLLSPEKKP